MKYKTDPNLLPDEIALVAWGTVCQESKGMELRLGRAWHADNTDAMTPAQMFLVAVSHLLEPKARNRQEADRLLNMIMSWYIRSVGNDVPQLEER